MDGDKLEDVIEEAVASDPVDAEQKTESEQEVEKGTSEEQKEEPQKEKPWLTSLPKNHRERASKYGSAAEYLDALAEGSEKGGGESKPETDDWDGFLEELSGDGEKAEANPMYQILRESGVSVDSSKKVIEGMNRQSEAALNKAKSELGDSMRKAWGSEYDVNKVALKRGIAAIGNRDEVKAMYSQGLMYNPAVLDLIAKLGRSSSEVNPPVGRPNAKDRPDPNNPLGYKD